MTERSLGKGYLNTTEQVLYVVPNNTETRITLLEFVSTHPTDTTYINISKKVNGINYPISPFYMSLGPSFMAQEDGGITLNATDSIVGISDVEDYVSYLVNGEEKSTLPEQPPTPAQNSTASNSQAKIQQPSIRTKI